ncbi:MAG: hypothetical protein FJ090_16565 [Deltaproteobacteria bacterium]|nr:hypothetical protein [Deltaproteobacteria bacterium]
MFSFLGCVAGVVAPAEGIAVSEAEQVVPGEGLPLEVLPQDANNNLDVAMLEGALYLAFRTAPSHFASPDTVMYVVRSVDGGHTWTHELSLAMGTDLREPRLLAFDGKLFLYFAVLGIDSSDFEPQGSMVVVREGGTWSEPAWLFENDFIPWRVRAVDSVPYMVGYTNGGDIYDFESEALPAIEVRWLTSGDGLQWTAAVPGQEVVQTGGGSETDWVFLPDGAVLAVTRNEAGDESGWGSNICRAEASALGDWRCVNDPRKYDSPLMFRQGGKNYLVARRNLTESGDYDLGYRDDSHVGQTLAYSADYWGQPKRCSLWEVDEVSLEVSFILDLPSRGDTCFPSALDEGGGRWTVYNYSSPVDGPDLSWLEGQLGRTYIYRQVLDFPVGG